MPVGQLARAKERQWYISETILELIDSLRRMAKKLAWTMFKVPISLRSILDLVGASVSTFSLVFIAGSGEANSLSFVGTHRR